MTIKVYTDLNPPATLKVTDLKGGKAYVLADDQHSRVVFGIDVDARPFGQGKTVCGIDTFGNIWDVADTDARFREVNVEIAVQPVTAQ